MGEESRYQIIDVKTGDITGAFNQDKVILKGVYRLRETEYIDHMVLSVVTGQGIEAASVKVPCGGSRVQLFINDFTGSGKHDLMIRGIMSDDTSNMFAFIYTYTKGKLQCIFDYNKWELIELSTVVDAHASKVEFLCERSNRKYSLDLAYNCSYFFKANQPNKEILLELSHIVEVYPVQSIYNNVYELMIRQNIVDKRSMESIATLQSQIVLREGQFEIVRQGVILEGQPVITKVQNTIDVDCFLAQLPRGAKVIEVQGEVLQEYGLEVLNSEGEREFYLPYRINTRAYVSVFKDDGQWRLLDTIRGKGSVVKDFKIMMMNGRKYVIVGWEIAEESIILDIFIVENNALKRAFQNKLPFYSKLDLEDLDGDGNKELILWMHEGNKVYRIQIYQLRGRKMVKTDRLNKLYYKKVVAYYDQLITTDTDNAIYRYYHMLAHIEIEQYQEALNLIETCMTMKEVYPSLGKLGQIKRVLLEKVQL